MSDEAVKGGSAAARETTALESLAEAMHDINDTLDRALDRMCGALGSTEKIIPADPGHFLISYNLNAGFVSAPIPVIAWRICPMTLMPLEVPAGARVYAVTSIGDAVDVSKRDENDIRCHAVQFPDGRVQAPCLGVVANEREFRAEVAKKASSKKRGS